MARPQATRKRRAAPKRERPRAKPNRRREARASRETRGSLGTWLSRHAQSLVGSLGRLAGHPLNTGMTMAVIGIALALPVLLHLSVTNIRALSGQWRDTVELSVYLEHGRSEAEARAVASALQERDDVAATEVVLADEALAEFRAGSGFGPALDTLTENPLPHLVSVRPEQTLTDADSVDRIAAAAAGLTGVAEVRADTDWVRRLHAMLDVGRRLVALAVAVLAVAILLIVGNTIRLDIQNRSQEIEVQKLVGASNAFIRRPFLYSGAWYGLGGGLIALAIVQSALWALAGPVGRLAGLYDSSFRLTGLKPGDALLVVAGGAVLGWLGSGIAAARNMRRIEPGRSD
jgi:cell division transport system permease protein